MNSQGGEMSGFSRDAILEQLDRMVSSVSFRGAERSTKLLRYIVEQTAGRRTDGLKEYTLGVEALGRSTSFDPRIDHIVRAEASRLRARLEKYYAGEGREDSLIIALPKGSYVPQFQLRAEEPSAALRIGSKLHSLSQRFTWLGVGVAVAVCLSALGILSARQSPPPNIPVSVAVLPFTNMSGDPDQEFFSDGMAEEINTALAKIPDLRVVARTSTFQFKNQNQDVQAVGRALHATHLVEGSVRKAGTRLRVTAQLIRADDGLSVWANSYDRELTDIFAVQEEIATSVAGALRIPLGLKAGQRLVSNRPADAETYDLYLRGRAAFAMRSREELGLLEQVVARDPNFAPGWAKLSESRREMALYFQRGGEEARWASLIEGAETAAKKAIALDPNYAGGYSALSGVYRWRGRLAEAMDLAKQGLALDAEEPELLSNYAEALHTLGYLKDGLRVRDQLALLEPFNPLYNRRRGELMLANGNIDAGINQLEALHGAAVAALYLAPAYAHQGRLVEAANALLELPIPQGTDARSSLDAAAEALRSAANKSEPLVKLSDCDCEFDFVYAYANAPEHMLDWPENAMRKGDYRPLQILWWPLPPDLRKAERFKALVREAGMVEYWRAHGWPDLCRPVGANDFVCD